MKVEAILNDFYDDDQFRFHLAKQSPSGTRPIDVLARSPLEWLGWQAYRGLQKERFVKDKIVSFAHMFGTKYLFGGVFDIVGREGEEYKVKHSDKYSEMIGRLVINYFGDNTQGTVFTPSYIISNSEISCVYEYKYQGKPFCSYDDIDHGFERLDIIIRNQLHWRSNSLLRGLIGLLTRRPSISLDNSVYLACKGSYSQTIRLLGPFVNQTYPKSPCLKETSPADQSAHCVLCCPIVKPCRQASKEANLILPHGFGATQFHGGAGTGAAERTGLTRTVLCSDKPMLKRVQPRKRIRENRIFGVEGGRCSW